MNRMKWFLSILFTAALCARYAVMYFPTSIRTNFIMIPLIIVLGAANIVCAVRSVLPRQNNTAPHSKAKTHMFVFKLLAIPYFIIYNFLSCLFIALFPLILPLGLVNPFNIRIWILIPFQVLFAYFILLVISSYSIAAILSYRRANRLTRVETAVHIVLQLIFVADVVDAAVLFFRLTDTRKPATGPALAG